MTMWLKRSTKLLLSLQGFLVGNCVYRGFQKHDMEWFAIGALILYSMYLNVRSDYRHYSEVLRVLKNIARVPSKTPPAVWRFGEGPICPRCGRPDVPRSVNPHSCGCPELN